MRVTAMTLCRRRSPNIYNHGYPADTPGVICTIDELQTLCDEWQKTLRISDWNINLNIVRQVTMPADAEGHCKTYRTLKYATISVLDPVDYDIDGYRKETQVQHDMERTLVHELLHVQFDLAIMDAEKMDMTAFEQAIDLTAWGLVNLKRKPKP